jgi:hypothetical protein
VQEEKRLTDIFLNNFFISLVLFFVSDFTLKPFFPFAPWRPCARFTLFFGQAQGLPLRSEPLKP